MERIYLDNNATTSVAPEVIEVILENLTSGPANPSSVHWFGQKAKSLLITNRHKIANIMEVNPENIIFTSGGTESMNMLIRGIMSKSQKRGIITSSIDHACVYETVKSLEKQGCIANFLSPSPKGFVEPQDVEKAIDEHTRLIVLSAVNSETGVKNDIEALAEIALFHQIPLVLDGVALLGKENFSIPKGVSAMGFSGHKIHAPKGIGFIILRNLNIIDPILTGGNQEYKKRAGTENLVGIVALAKALELSYERMSYNFTHMKELRDLLEKSLLENIPNIIVNSSEPRICNTSNISFPGIDGETLLANLDMKGISVSHGSACSSAALEPSRILLNMGIPRKLAESAIRFSLSRYTTPEEIRITVQSILNIKNLA